MTEDDTALRAFLRNWAGGHEIETHAARVYLGEETALKVKRPVRYAYLDFTQREVRKQVLERELALNKPNAPQIYRDLVPITLADGAFAIDGRGDVVEWALRMWRFPAEAGLDRIAKAGEFTLELAEALGRKIHDLHTKNEKRAADGAALMTEILTGFEQEFCDVAGQGLHLPATPVLRQTAEALEKFKGALSNRAQQGYVRRCHGDLHLRNIVVLDGEPLPFDALEFSERLATCDVLYDLAFLLMDIQQQGLFAQANRVLNAYVDQEQDTDALAGLAVMPLFLAMRALVRSVVSADLAVTGPVPEAETRARRYLEFASRVLSPDPPVLYVVAGLSGTGKTTVARALAPELPGPCGAVHLRSDIERKRAAGVCPLTRLPPSAYTRENNEAVYETLFRKAEVVLKAGSSVILDAVFARPEERAAAEAVAHRCGVAFRGLWLDAPETVRCARVDTRQGDASDATPEVVQRQSDLETGEITWEVWQADVETEPLVARMLGRTTNDDVPKT